MISMYALQLASGKPSALVDWNNNYARRAGQVRAVPLRQLGQELLCRANRRCATARSWPPCWAQNNTYGTVSAQAAPSPLTYARLTTDDRHGKIKTYVGEGRITDDPLDTFGSRAVVEIPDLQKLLRYICKNGYEHHCAMNPSAFRRCAGRGVRDLPGLGRVLPPLSNEARRKT